MPADSALRDATCRHRQTSARPTSRITARAAKVPNVTADAVGSIFIRNVVDHFAATLITEIDIEVEY